LRAFRAEAEALSAAMSAVRPDEWALPTRCAPWSIADLLGHVTVVIDWLPGMLAAAAPPRAETDAVGYYRPDARFSPASNAHRVDLARERAAHARPTPAADFEATWRAVDRLCAVEPDGRLVRTRHGDAIALADFLLTRVVELALHGLDLADALGRDSWLTPEAAAALLALLGGTAAAEAPGWSPERLLRAASGRAPFPSADHRTACDLGLRALTLG